LNLGVDGFRMDVINFLTTNGITKDNPIKNGKQDPIYDRNQPNIKEAIRTIKTTINEYKNRFLVGEIGSNQLSVLKKYQTRGLLDVVFDFSKTPIKITLISKEKVLFGYTTILPNGYLIIKQRK
jgi:trehalose-6-phosphate hydrolase